MVDEVAAKCGIYLFNVLFHNVWDLTDTDLEFKNGALGERRRTSLVISMPQNSYICTLLPKIRKL